MEPKPRHIKGGYVDPKKLPRGPNGRAQCRQCAAEVPANRRTFCGQPCIDLWMVRTGSGMAKFIKKRDKGICAICGLDCEALKKELRKLEKSFSVADHPPLTDADYENEFLLTAAAHQRLKDHDSAKREARKAAKAAAREFKTKHGIPHHRSRFWDVDHIVPVIEGGGDSGPKNLRTLCLGCHRSETAKLALRRAAERKSRKLPSGL